MLWLPYELQIERFELVKITFKTDHASAFIWSICICTFGIWITEFQKGSSKTHVSTFVDIVTINASSIETYEGLYWCVYIGKWWLKSLICAFWITPIMSPVLLTIYKPIMKLNVVSNINAFSEPDNMPILSVYRYELKYCAKVLHHMCSSEFQDHFRK